MSRFVIIILILSFPGCNHTHPGIKKNIGTGKLIPIDFTDTRLSGLNPWIKDTTLLSGWSIKYFIKDDTTKYRDLYVEWSNGNKKGIWAATSVSGLHAMSIPQYVGENRKCIFMTHVCAKDCSSILVLRKDSIPVSFDYKDVVKYSIKYGKLVYVTDTSYQQDTVLEVSLVDLYKKDENIVRFNHACPAVYKPAYIDTVIFGFNKSVIKAKFIDND